MTEGSWAQNGAFDSTSTSQYYQDMRSFVARYLMLSSGTTVTNGTTTQPLNRSYWAYFNGALSSSTDYGVLCDTNSVSPTQTYCIDEDSYYSYDIYGGTAYNTVYNWLADHTITLCTKVTSGSTPYPCNEASAASVWVIPITSGTSTYNAVWTFGNPSGGVTCPGTNPGCPSLTSFTGFETLDGVNHTFGGTKSINITEEPKLLY